VQEVRPGVLWFLRNPNDPNFQPVKEMVDQPLAHHTRRIAMSAVLYALIAAAVVHLPVRAATLIGTVSQGVGKRLGYRTREC
jgi:E3 ubiquitin-protein ligase MARCH6